MEEGRRRSRRGGVSNLENVFAPEGMNSMCKRGIEEQPGSGRWVVVAGGRDPGGAVVICVIAGTEYPVKAARGRKGLTPVSW